MNLLQLVTVLHVLVMNCGMTSDQVNLIMDDPSKLKNVCIEELKFSPRKYKALEVLADLWMSEENLDLFNFGKYK